MICIFPTNGTYCSTANKTVKQYVYDPAGNILSKTVNGKTTAYTYDKANQLVTSTADGKVTNYQYDAAGRLVKEGNKTYTYGYLDKVLAVQENGKRTASFDYYIDGQIASATHGDKKEDFLWDGLALIHRGKTSYINEPYVTGGNPILSSKDGVMFNDMLGSSLNIGGKPVSMTAFGECVDSNAMYTGKPYIGELGYAFLFRNYRPDYGKWQTTDPLGYPDGWNNLKYTRNYVVNSIDSFGTKTVTITGIATKMNQEINGYAFYNYIENDKYYYVITSSWIVEYSVELAYANNYTCDSPYCHGHHYEPSEADLTYKKVSPLVEMIIGPYEEPIPEDALLKNMLKWQDELKRRMEEDMNKLPQTINIERYFSFSQCLE